MPRFQYMNFPPPFYKSPYRSPSGFYSPRKTTIQTIENNFEHLPAIDNINSKTMCTNLDMKDKKFRDKKNKSNNNTDDYLFDLFGLKIYSDDVLLVSLIYFLYSEGVKDDGLFLVLILLLLS